MQNRFHPVGCDLHDYGRALERLAARVHELWHSCGEPVVQDDAIWQEAERELRLEQSERGCAVRHCRG